MLQLLVLAAGGLSVAYALRWVSREYDRVESSLRRMDARLSQNMPAGAPLILDSAQGFYRPVE
jgi:hypothetical protein